MIDMEVNHIVRLRNLLQRSGTSPLHVVVSTKKLNRGISSPYSALSHPTSFAYYNNRILNNNWPRSLTPSFSPSGLPADKFPFLTQKEFDGFVGRCATLDAFIQKDHTFYVTPESTVLITPMPYLKTLRLVQGNDPRRNSSVWVGGALNPLAEANITPDSLPFPLFQKDTPRLRELCFDIVHARWEDPIYRNLTNLRLHTPTQKAPLPQILRILQACPKLTDLELTRCLIEGSSVADHINDVEETAVPISISNPTELSNYIVSLPHLRFFHFEEYDHTSYINLLSSISLPELEYLHIDNAGINSSDSTRQTNRGRPDLSCFTDRFGRPLKSIADTIREPSYLCISAQLGHISLSALHSIHKLDSTRPLTRMSPNVSKPARYPRGPSHYPGNVPFNQGRLDNRSSPQRRRQMEISESGNDKEGGIWTFIARADTFGLTGPHVDVEEWKAAAFTFGLPIESNFSFSAFPSSSPHSLSTSAEDTSYSSPSLPPPPPPPLPTIPPLGVPGFPPLGLPGLPQFQYANAFSFGNQGMSPLFEPLSRELVDLFENASLGGLQFHSIEKLHLELTNNYPDFFYRDIFTKCSRVRKFKASYNRGVGILAAVMRDDLLPMLEEVYLDGVEGYGSAPAQPTPDVLANWVEVRQRRAGMRHGTTVEQSKTAEVTLERSGIHRLKKLFVRIYDDNQPSLSEVVRERLEDALGNDGEFIWRSEANPWASMQQQWTKVMETDGEIDIDSNTLVKSRIEANEEGVDIHVEENGHKENLMDLNLTPEDSLLREWSLTGSRPIQGWSAGPW